MAEPTTTRIDADASSHVLESVRRKRLGLSLGANAIERLVSDFVAGSIPDYQKAAWLATVACTGMSMDETEALTRAYLTGGKRADLTGLGRIVLDKHSTGGVGDKVSLVVVPTVAACGVAVAKVSGRGLGHAGGTVDKLESIQGLRLQLSAGELRSLLMDVGMVISAQSDELAPGDRATYAMRDVTATVESVPLIAASIISKKVAVGADGLLLDVKTGSGALLPDAATSALLAETMIELARRFGLRCRAVLSDMDQPLGYAVGNALEVKEALSVLRGDKIPGLSALCETLAKLMLQLDTPGLTDSAAAARVCRALDSGAAYEQFLRWASAQGADPRQLAEPERLGVARHRKVVVAPETGWITRINPRAIGSAAVRVGAGRLAQSAALDHRAGVVLHRRVGDWVSRGESLAEVHFDKDGDDALALTASAFTLSSLKPAMPPVVHKIFGDGVA